MEFTGLRKDTTPISIGIISEDGRTFYAEFTDYDRTQVNDWIKENVISNLRFELPKPGEEYFYIAARDQSNPVGNDLYSAYSVELNGTKDIISKELRKWLAQFDSAQFVSDVCHYDFVLLIDLLTNGGTALDLPKNISPVCHDINMDIAGHCGVSDYEAFDMSREKIVVGFNISSYDVAGNKHNSLYDAHVIRAIWNEIKSMKLFASKNMDFVMCDGIL